MNMNNTAFDHLLSLGMMLNIPSAGTFFKALRSSLGMMSMRKSNISVL